MKSNRALGGALALGSLVFGVSASLADPLPLGKEFQINTTTTGDQRQVRVASRSDGAFVVVWQGPEGGGSGQGIRAQRYSSSGVASGSEFAVNSTTSGDQTRPAVAMLSNGDFVVVWQGPDASGTGIFARRFLANGSPSSNELAVNQTTSGTQETPAVAYLEDGQFLAAWRSYGQDGSLGGIYARLFNSGGSSSSELLVNTTTTGDQADPAVAAAELPAPIYYVAWEGPDAAATGIFLQRVSTSATLVGSEVAVNTVMTGAQENPAVAASSYVDPLAPTPGIGSGAGENRVVVVWQGPDSGSSPAGRSRIWYQLYDSTATTHGANQLIDDDPTAPEQTDPEVAIADTAPNGFVPFTAVWTETAGTPLTGSSISIRAANRPRSHYFNGAVRPGLAGGGETPNSEVLVTSPGTAAALPAIAAASDGDFVCAWQVADLDGSGDGIYGRRFAVDSAPVLELRKTVSGSLSPGGKITYTLVLENFGPSALADNDGAEIKDELPGSLHLIAADAESGEVDADTRTNVVSWNGGLGIGETLVLTITAQIDYDASGQIVNQAFLNYDADLDNENETSLPSDDPGVAGEENPTVFAVSESLFEDSFESGGTWGWAESLGLEP